MTDLTIYKPGRVAIRAERANQRQLDSLRRDTALVAARHTSAIDVIETVTESALLATAHVSALEGYLVGRVPHAEGRLRHVADGGAVAMANVVAKLAKS